MMFFVYIIYSEKFDRFYIGQTENVVNRLKRHNNGYEKATSPYKPWVVKCVIEKSSRGEVMILEKKLKNLSREKLIDFIDKYG
jgi:putative endonuclease